jgi:glutathione S-transferase
METSGNCHKVKMALDLLGLPYEWREVDLMKGGTRTPEFLAMNPNGKVPVLAIDGSTFLPESNAILCYLGEGTKLVPDDRLERARMLQWMFFEQYTHEPAIAVPASCASSSASTMIRACRSCSGEAMRRSK